MLGISYHFLQYTSRGLYTQTLMKKSCLPIKTVISLVVFLPFHIFAQRNGKLNSAGAAAGFGGKAISLCGMIDADKCEAFHIRCSL